jgi:predicted AlkP superfamily phosphohydrolase/phosphomutase
MAASASTSRDASPRARCNRGAEYEAFLEELSRDLLDIKNVETGRRIVNRVIRKSDLYQGEGTEHFPDIFVEWVGSIRCA